MDEPRTGCNDPTGQAGVGRYTQNPIPRDFWQWLYLSLRVGVDMVWTRVLPYSTYTELPRRADHL